MKEREDGSEHGSICAPGGAQPSGAVGPVLAAPAPSPLDDAVAHRRHRDCHRRRAGGLAPVGAVGHTGRRRERGRSRSGEHDPDRRHAGQRGQHERTRRQREDDQRRVPRRRDQQRSGSFRVLDGQGVQRADGSHQPLRQPDQQLRRHQRAQDQPDDRQLRSGEQRQHAVALPAMDTGEPTRVRRRRRHRDLGRGQPALRHRAGPDPADQRVEHHHQLDADGLPLPVVDRTRPGAGAVPPPCSGA